ncbi:MAG TPA: DUF167 domain-containing protein [Polyangiaceae bacterium]|nr:DUF167 domain-containing protein [Polyangiaceae bacterium]
MTLLVRVKPRASRNAVGGIREGALEVSVRAPPVDGAANDALRETLAEHFGVSRSAVVVESGETSRTKRVLLRGLGVEDVRARL